MATDEKLISLIDRASAAVGSQAKLAELLELHKSHITQMKQGTRNASWRVRGKMRAILGEDPTHAFMAAMAEDLAASENADEKKAADGFNAMLAAFPDGWRKRMFTQLRGWLGAIDRTLDNGRAYSVFCS
jgi:DNA-binding transcriptional regulator YdaS (Cro superfamily)